METCRITIEEANGRLDTNIAELGTTDGHIAETESFKATREADLAIANDDMDVETDRW